MLAPTATAARSTGDTRPAIKVSTKPFAVWASWPPRMGRASASWARNSVRLDGDKLNTNRGSCMKAATLTQSDLPGQQTYPADLLETLFHDCFGEQFNTLLVGGKEEPFYRSSRNGEQAEIHYRHDYFRSALHEVAHWCVAGEARRQQDDYGYWYAPDGRNAGQQKAFEQVEVLPQA